MLDLLAVVVRLFIEAPLLSFGLVSMAVARWAKRRKLPLWWLGLPVAAVWLYKNRRDLRAVVLWCSGVVVALVWVGLLWSSPGLRFAVGVAVPTGLAVLILVWLMANYGEYPVHIAAQLAVADWRSREVVTDAVAATAGEEAKVLEVKASTGGDFEAVVVGPPGMAHADLVDVLRASLAESILAQSGRVVREVSVAGTAAKGRVRVRCSTSNPYAATVGLDDL